MIDESDKDHLKHLRIVPGSQFVVVEAMKVVIAYTDPRSVQRANIVTHALVNKTFLVISVGLVTPKDAHGFKIIRSRVLMENALYEWSFIPVVYRESSLKSYGVELIA